MRSFGVYCPGSTIAHRLDPRAKLTFVFLYLVAAFVASAPAMLAVLAVVAVASLASARISVRQALRMLRPFIWLLIFVAVFDVLFYGGGEAILEVGIVEVTTGGIVYAVKSVVRFACMLLGTSALMYTTSPTELTDGFAMILAPLRRFGLRTDTVALALSMTLRFIPLLMDEFSRVKAAQEARLADFTGGVRSRLKAYTTVLVPLFTGALRRADTLALAIENRGYGTADARTCIRVYRMRGADAVVIAGACVLLVLAVVF